MPVYQYYPNASSGGNTTNEDPRFTQMMNEVPDREVFVKNADDSMTGTGMLLLEDNTLLAPEGFATESGSINFGDLITLSEASGFLAIQNNLNGNRYRLVDHYVPKDAPSSKPGYVHMYEAENEFISQGTFDTTLNANPLIFSYTTALLSRVNSLKFKTASAMTNFRMKITAVGPNVVVKYFPTKAAWVQSSGGVDLVSGDNVLDFKDTPLLFDPGTTLSFEIRATSVSMLGNSSGMPYMTAMVQRGQFKYLANEEDIPENVSSFNNDAGYVTEADIPTALSELTNDTGFVTASQAASGAPVQSVNGQTGNVTLTIPEAQVASDWNATSGVTQILNKPTSFTPSAHTHVISDVTGLQSALDTKTTVAQASAAAPVQSVNGQTGNVSLTIPAAQIQSDWNQANTSALDYIKNKPSIPAVNYPVTSVNTKTGAVVLTNTDVGAAATVHTHAISDVNGLQSALDSKASISSLGSYVTTNSLTNTLSGYVPNTALSGYVTTSALNTALGTKFNIPTGATNQYVRGDGSLATFPSIPSSQVNADWNATSGVAQILNKPVLFDGTWNSLTGKPTTFAPSSHTHSISEVTGLQTALDSKFATPTGTTSQYLRGNGSLATFPTNVSSFTNDSGYLTAATVATLGLRRVETFLTTSDASGNIAITFANTYATPPDVQPQIIGGTFNQMVRVVSVSTTGCVIQAAQRNLVTLLAVEVLLGATVALAGASVSVQITARS